MKMQGTIRKARRAEYENLSLSAQNRLMAE